MKSKDQDHLDSGTTEDVNSFSSEKSLDFMPIGSSSDIDMLESLNLPIREDDFFRGLEQSEEELVDDMPFIKAYASNFPKEATLIKLGNKNRKGVTTSQKLKNLSGTNSIKNFIKNFVKYIGSKESGAKDIFMQISEINPNLKKFQRLIECLKKKIKKDLHTLGHLKSLLGYKDEHYTNFILDMCQQFLDNYHQIVRKSPRMGNENLSVIPTISNLLTFQRDSILYVNNKYNSQNQF